MSETPLLEIDNLRVDFHTPTGIVRAVRGLSFTLGRERLGIVGESGSGKSVTSYAVMRILDRAGKIADGSITFSGTGDGRWRFCKECRRCGDST